MAESFLVADQPFDVVTAILSVRERALDLVKPPGEGNCLGAESNPDHLILSDPGVPDTGFSEQLPSPFEG